MESLRSDRISPKVRDSASRSRVREKLVVLEQIISSNKETNEPSMSIDEHFKTLFKTLRDGTKLHQEEISSPITNSDDTSAYRLYAEKEMEKLRDRILELERSNGNENEDLLEKAVRRAHQTERTNLTLRMENQHLRSELESLQKDYDRLRATNVNLKDRNEGLHVQLDVMKKSFVVISKEKVELETTLKKVTPIKTTKTTSTTNTPSPITMRAKAFMGRFLSSPKTKN